MAKENPRVLDAISGAAHSADVSEAEFRAGGQCIRDFAHRRQDLIDATGMIRGMYLVSVEIRNEEGRVVGIAAKGGEDEEMFDCLRQNRVWLSGKPFPAKGAPDGTTTIEWPYRLNSGKPPAGQ
jgi:hypothetical protein